MKLNIQVTPAFGSVVGKKKKSSSKTLTNLNLFPHHQLHFYQQLQQKMECF